MLRLVLPALVRLMAAWCAVAAAAEPSAVAPLELIEIADGVYVHEGKQESWGATTHGDVANLGFIVGSRCVAVIDSGGSPAIGAALRAAVERTTPTPICYVINTHTHPDHVFGNVAFTGMDPPPQFVGHARLAAALAARAPFYLNALERDLGIAADPALIVYPGVPVADTLELELGERVLSLRAWPTAHTDNDLTVFDERTGTLFASDLLFVGHIPVIDGRLTGWLSVMQEMVKMRPARVVPGHGGVSADWPGIMAPQEQYLRAILDQTREAIRNRVTIGEAVERVANDAATEWLLAEQFHRRNVTAAYAELEWED